MEIPVRLDVRPHALPSPSTTDASKGCTPEEMALWRKFEDLPQIPGLDGNLIVVQVKDTAIQGNLSTKCSPEIEFGAEICKYLLRNGVNEARLICNIVGQTRMIQKGFDEMQKESNIEADGIVLALNEDDNEDPEDANLSCDVTVVTLLFAYGPYQQMQIFKLIQNSISNSRAGVVIIADKTVTCNAINPKWTEFLKHLEKENLWKDHLKLVCMKHEQESDIFSAADLREVSPLGGCDSPCGEMECGHYCPYICHPRDLDHLTHKFCCKLPCERACPSSGHKCRKLCWEDCGKCYHVITEDYSCVHQKLSKQAFCCEDLLDRCKIPVRKIIPCGHSGVMECWEDELAYKCTEPVALTLPCGHINMYSCSELPKSTDVVCIAGATKMLNCGHTVWSTCSEALSNQGKLKCTQYCREKLKCGHECNMPCHEDPNYHQYAKCPQPCERYCGRGIHKCPEGSHICGEPCKPCMQDYIFKLGCCHELRIVCSDPNPDENTYQCNQGCLKLHPFCDHRCERRCFEDCGNCEKTVMTIPLGCMRLHRVPRKCSERLIRCEALTKAVNKTTCGHSVMVPCFQADNLSAQDLNQFCTAYCVAEFNEKNECGHQCSGTCKLCYQGRFHVRCTAPCDKILICGHNCPNTCSMVCRPCSRRCENSCEHKKCEYECGVPCVLKCEEPCSYACKHSQCTLKCSEVCNKTICFEPCLKMQDCGHPCVSYCGEICPPYCRICDPDILSIGIFSEKAVGDIETRFIYITACGHCIETEDLEMWIQASISSEEVLPLRCPICRARMKWINRFSSYFQENWQTINTIRKKIFGFQDKIDDILLDVETKVNTYMNANARPFGSSDYAMAILEELTEPRKKASEDDKDHGLFQSTDIQKARFLRWISREYIDVAEIMKKCYVLPPSTFRHLESHWEAYLMMMFDGSEDEGCRYWPLHPNEISALRRERRRLDDSLLLHSTHLKTTPPHILELLNTSGVRKMFAAAEKELWIRKPYTVEARSAFLGKLRDLNCALNYTLNVTDRERREIVSAFGDRSGRWFKCANGHIYVITECGGATEIGMCNECGAPIGGENHQMLEQNYLSTEMDNAEEPLYPTALNRGT